MLFHNYFVSTDTNKIELGLERILLLLARLNNPHLNLPYVIHIAGTNGKGSVLAFLKAIFNQANYTVHRYTSPHLVGLMSELKLLIILFLMQNLTSFLPNATWLVKFRQK